MGFKESFSRDTDLGIISDGIGGIGNLGVAGLKATREEFNLSNGDFITLGVVNVVRDYRWAIKTPNQDFIDQVPCIKLVEYQPLDAPLLEDFAYTTELLAVTGNAVAAKLDPKVAAKEAKAREAKGEGDPGVYASMYRGTPTENIYTLPFFNQYNHDIRNGWEVVTVDGKVTGNEKLRATAAKHAGIASRGGSEERNIFRQTSKASYTFEFMLFNTFSESDIAKNMSFITVLQANNLVSRTSALTFRSPCFYEVDIPGVRSSPAAYINSLSVLNVGQVNKRILDGVEVNIPDAWRITIGIQELLAESKQILAGVHDQANKIRVIKTT